MNQDFGAANNPSQCYQISQDLTNVVCPSTAKASPSFLNFFRKLLIVLKIRQNYQRDFLRVLRFSPLLKNQDFQILIRSRFQWTSTTMWRCHCKFPLLLLRKQMTRKNFKNLLANPTSPSLYKLSQMTNKAGEKGKLGKFDKFIRFSNLSHPCTRY